jgi:hypothetical protein
MRRDELPACALAISCKVETTSVSIFVSSCDVLKPSKKCTKGTRASSVAACALTARSCASCTDAEPSIANPVDRIAITSLWSPKMDRAWVARARRDVKDDGRQFARDLEHVRNHQQEAWLAVNVEARAPAWSSPWTAPAAPSPLCISTTAGIAPQRLGRAAAAQASAFSAMLDEGVIG